MNWLATLGRQGLGELGALRHLCALLWGLGVVIWRPGSWRRTVRAVLVRQLVAVAGGSAWLVIFVALAVGVSTVAQALLWEQRIGQPQLLGPLLNAVLVREVVPVLTNLLVIARSGTALTGELAQILQRGEARALDAQGLDPFIYLLMPRVVAVVLSVLLLNLVFLGVALYAGYLTGALLGVSVKAPLTFLASLIGDLQAVDYWNFLAKSLLPALTTGLICCALGLGEEAERSTPTRLISRALSRSVISLFLITALLSLLTYL